MNCDEAREGLWPPERPRLLDGEIAEARAHVAACPECSAYFAQDRALLESYDRLRGDAAPIEVREKVFDALSRARWQTLGAEARPREDRGRRWTTRAVLPLLAAAGLTAIALGTLERNASEPTVSVADDPAMFVEDYLRRAVGQDHIQTSDPAEIVQFLQRELGIRLQPLDVEGLELVGAEICLLEGHRGAMIVYKKDGVPISHYLVPRDGAAPRNPRLSDQRAGRGESPPVVTWSTSQVEQALVAELSADQLIRLASGSSDE